MNTDADKAYQNIKEKIITVAVKPGEAIRETDLMGDLNLGRTPIREALKRLQAESLVVSIPRRGMFVADVSITDLAQIYEVRFVLEPLSARLASQRAGSQHIQELRALLAEFREAASPDKKFLVEMEYRYHTLLSQAAHNKFLRTEIELLHNLTSRIWHLALPYLQPEDIDIEAHIEILAAVESHAGDLAEQSMRQHLERVYANIKRYF